MESFAAHNFSKTCLMWYRCSSAILPEDYYVIQVLLLQSQNPSKFQSLVLENMLESEQVQMVFCHIHIC